MTKSQWHVASAPRLLQRRRARAGASSAKFSAFHGLTTSASFYEPRTPEPVSQAEVLS